MTRPSRLDLLHQCPQSALPCEHPHTPDSQEAADGRAAHALIAAMVRGVRTDGIDEDHGATLAAARRVLDEVRSWVPDGLDHTEYPASGLVTQGTADYVRIGSQSTVIVDWKTGWLDTPHPHQLAGYASCVRAMHGMPMSGRITVVEAWLRHGERSVRHLSAADLDAWETATIAAEARAATTVTAGPHCTYCPRQLVCDQRAAYVRSAATTLPTLVSAGLPMRDTLAGLYRQYQALRSALARYEELLAAELELGPLSLGHGRQLRLEPQHRETIRWTRDTQQVLLDAGLSHEQIADCVTGVSKSAIQEILRGNAPRGKGAEAMRHLLSRLRDIGAVMTDEQLRRVERDE